MSCDIHVVVENSFTSREGQTYWYKLASIGFHAHNYAIFELLAGVRCPAIGATMATALKEKVVTKEQLDPELREVGSKGYYLLEYLYPPRGIPDDANSDTKAWYESYGTGAHSASHLYLDELEHAQSLYQKLPQVKSKVDLDIDMDTWEQYMEGEITRQEYAELCKQVIYEPEENLDRIIALIRKCNEQGSPARMVFFFDN